MLNSQYIFPCIYFSFFFFFLLQLQNRPWRKPLTMGCQETEVQAQYKGAQTQPGVDFGNKLAANPQPPGLQMHNDNMPTRVRVGSYRYSYQFECQELKSVVQQWPTF